MKSYSAIIALIAAGIISAPAQSTELDQLKSAMQTMQKNMEDMQKKIAELEAEKGAAAVPGTNVAGGITFAPPSKPLIPHASPITDRQNMNDQQAAAPRLNDLTLDPEYYGFFPIPNTPGAHQIERQAARGHDGGQPEFRQRGPVCHGNHSD